MKPILKQKANDKDLEIWTVPLGTCCLPHDDSHSMSFLSQTLKLLA